MRNVMLILFTPLLLTACESTPPMLEDFLCSDDSGSQPINIHYGDSQIKVTPPYYEVRKNKNLKFRLLPDNSSRPGNLDYGKVMVTIKSKDPMKNTWLTVSGTKDASTNSTLVACMPTTQPLGELEYLVEVEQVGMLDPRVKVIP